MADNTRRSERSGAASNAPRRVSGRDSFLSRHAARQRKRRIRNNAVAVVATGCIVLACLVWVLCFTFYNVSSNSMYPALHGLLDSRDRLLCWRPAYRYREPKRWEIAIFQAPENAANVEIMPGINSGGETGMTVKRIVGLPGERIALAGGDAWTAGPSGAFTRRVKPDSVQRGMWIGVYAEDFSDIRTLEELYSFWDEEGEGGATLGPEPCLILVPSAKDYGMRFRPMTRAGGWGDTQLLLPGVPDRYVLPQTVLFRCPNAACGTEFSVAVHDQKIQGRCPKCGLLAPETSVTFYSERSGLPEIGPYAAGFRGPVQGDGEHFRANSYFFVSDLRLVTEVKLQEPDAIFTLRLEGDEGAVEASLAASGATVGGEPAEAGALTPGEWTRVEFYRADGAVRLFVGPDRKQAFDAVMWRGEKPAASFRGEKSGVSFRASRGVVAVRSVAVDRDVHYFSGRDQGFRNYLTGMDRDGSVAVGPDRFFPLGDNTTVSLDARSWGPVPLDRLRGVALMIWRPKERAGFIPRP